MVVGGACALASLAPAAAWCEERVSQRISAVLARPELGSASCAVEVREIPGGRVVFSQLAGKSLRPASVQKLVTTAAALDAFGAAWRVRTTVETAGRLDSAGRLIGDVFLVGRGDPNLSGRFFEGRVTAPLERLADALVAAGVREIEGRLVGHEGHFAGERRGDAWSWQDLVWWYGAEVSALSFNDNCANLEVRPGDRPGDPIRIRPEPLSSYYQVESTAVTSASGSEDDLTLLPGLGSTRIRLSGSYPVDAPPRTLYVALEDPARYATTVFSEVLATRGIRHSGPVQTATSPLPAEARVLAEHEGPSLAEVIAEINKKSENLHAEMLLRQLGRQHGGEGSAAAGLSTLLAFLERLGVEAAGFDLRDGSGLSRSNLVTAHGLVDLLSAMDRHPHAAAFRASLAVAGTDGTLERRLKAARGQLLAKTGTLDQMSALAGYATRRDGKRLAFAVIINNHTGQASAATSAVDAIAQALVE
jgi:serine-type D-Ala-D-Ala carboxypeptidase/endopeptidase (penicillin-binding protein 4)